jgi:hypothetical protein
MCRKTLTSCRTEKDFLGYIQYKGGEIIRCTHGVKIIGPKKPGYAVIHSNHKKELATGTRAALIKALIAIGLGGISLGIFIINKLAGG